MLYSSHFVSSLVPSHVARIIDRVLFQKTTLCVYFWTVVRLSAVALGRADWSIDGAYLLAGMRARKWRAGKRTRFRRQEAGWPRIYVVDELYGRVTRRFCPRMKGLVRIPKSFSLYSRKKLTRKALANIHAEHATIYLTSYRLHVLCACSCRLLCHVTRFHELALVSE